MEKYSAQVIKRPEEISGDTAKSEDALKHVIVEVQKIIPPRLIAWFLQIPPLWRVILTARSTKLFQKMPIRFFLGGFKRFLHLKKLMEF